jgi:CMP-N-acetylneuraminic acid synthetase
MIGNPEVKSGQLFGGDMVPMNDIIAYDINHHPGEHFLQTHSTNPLLSAKALEEGIKTYFSMPHEFDSVFSVTRWQTRLYWSSGQPINHNPAELIRTQDLSPVFEDNSNFYVFSRAAFKRADKRRIGLKPKMVVMDKIEAIDIDEGPDFKLAETLYIMKKNMHTSN